LQVVQHQLECDVDGSASALDDCDSSSCSSSGEEGLAIMVDVDGVVGGVPSAASGGSSSGGASTTVLTPRVWAAQWRLLVACFLLSGAVTVARHAAQASTTVRDIFPSVDDVDAVVVESGGS
jgi:hypothetical protein